MCKIDEQYEYFERWKELKRNLDFTKQLQWKNVYYAFLLFSVNIYLFKLIGNSEIKNFIAIFICCLSSYYHFSHFCTLSKYRSQLAIIEDEFLTNKLKDSIDKKYTSRKKTFLKKYYLNRIPFICNYIIFPMSNKCKFSITIFVYLMTFIFINVLRIYVTKNYINKTNFNKRNVYIQNPNAFSQTNKVMIINPIRKKKPFKKNLTKSTNNK